MIIIMLVSAAFSVAIYKVLANELTRVERLQRSRQQRILQGIPEELRPSPRQSIDPQIIEETKDRLKIILVLINMGILSFSGVAGYFLAGRTLKPISEMVEDQKRFIADASHELMTPITSMRTETEVTLRDKTLDSKKAKKLLESNLDEITKLQNLTDSLIKLTKYQKSDKQITETVSIKEVTRAAIQKVSALAASKNIKIKNNTNDIKITTEKNGLVELFVILLDNAIKYSPQNSQVLISSKQQDSKIQILVKDNGIGISKSDQDHLFDRFYRAEKSRSKGKVAGYGLGLSIAKQIVERHAGSIKVESKEKNGSTFIVELPTSKIK